METLFILLKKSNEIENLMTIVFIFIALGILLGGAWALDNDKNPRGCAIMAGIILGVFAGVIFGVPYWEDQEVFFWELF